MLYTDTQTTVAAKSGTQIRGLACIKLKPYNFHSRKHMFLNVCVPLPTSDVIKSVLKTCYAPCILVSLYFVGTQMKLIVTGGAFQYIIYSLSSSLRSSDLCPTPDSGNTWASWLRTKDSWVWFGVQGLQGSWPGSLLHSGSLEPFQICFNLTPRAAPGAKPGSLVSFGPGIYKAARNCQGPGQPQ